jgi:multiple sugar transport system substrate-binding protein
MAKQLDAPGVCTVAPGTKLTLKLRAAFIPEANDILKAVVLDWSNKTGVPVEVDIVSMNDLQTIAATAAETGAGPDIIELNQNSPFLFAEKLVDVSDIATKLGDKYGGWYPVAEEAAKVDGKWMAIPRFFAAHAITYRTDLLKEVGVEKPPATWDEMLELGKKLKAAGQPPVGFPLGHAVGDGNDFAYSLLWSFGGKEVAEDGKTVTINSPETIAALEYIKKLYDEGMIPDVVSWDDAANNRTYLAGEVAATNNAASIWVTARNNNVAVPYSDTLRLHSVTSHSQYPAGPAGQAAYAEMMSQAIFNYSPNVECAKILIQYLNENDQLAPWAQAGFSFNYPLLKAYEDMTIMPWNTQPKLKAFKGIAADAHLPGYPGNTANGRAAAEAYAKWIILDMFTKAATGTPPAEAAAWAESQLKEIYK